MVVIFFLVEENRAPRNKTSSRPVTKSLTNGFFITRQGKKNNLNILKKKSFFYNGRKQKEKTRAEHTEINHQLTWHQVTDEHFVLTRQERKKQSEYSKKKNSHFFWMEENRAP